MPISTTHSNQKKIKFLHGFPQRIALPIVLFFFIAFNSFAKQTSYDSLAAEYLKIYGSYMYGGFFKSINYKAVIPIRTNYPKITNPELKAETAYLLGQLHIFLYDMPSATEFYKESCQEYERIHNWKLYFMSAQRLSLSYRGSSQSDKVMPLLNKCLDISKKHDTGIYVLGIYHELVLLNTYNNNHPETALKYGQIFLDTLETLNKRAAKNKFYIQTNTYTKNTIFLEMGRCYLKLGQFKKAEKYLNISEIYFHNIQELNKLARVYESSIQLHLAQRNDKLLSKYFDSLMVYNKKNRNFSNVNYRKTHTYFRELYRLEEIDKSRKIEIENLHKNYYFLGGGLIFVLLCAMFGLFYYQKAQKNQEKVNQLLTKEFENSIKTSKEKSKYFAILSHELRTPIYAITGLAKLLEQKENNNPENISAIINSGNHLLHLVNNVIQHNKLEEAGEVKLDEGDYNLAETIKSIKQTTSYMARQKNILVHIISNLHENLIVFGDKQKLAQILINLVTNAIRYSPDHSLVSIAINQSDLDNEGYAIYQFSIQDHGMGISPNQLKNIFKYKETNQTPDSLKNENLQGMGIGLYVVSNYLMAMGSQIMVRSQKEIGSEFYFDLKLKSVKTIIPESVSLEFKSKNYTILVVDDNSINLIVAKKNIETLGLHCITAKDNDPILDIIATHDIDLILMDLNMPIINGFDLSQKIREVGYTMPIIAHTAVLMDHIDAQALKDANMQDFILKPYEIEDLKEKLVYYLEIYPQKRTDKPPYQKYA